MDTRSHTPTPARKPTNPARERMRQRVRRYKGALSAAALLLFGGFGVAIAHPDLSALFTSTASNQTNQSNQNVQATPTSTLLNQGGSSNGTSTSTQTPVTSTTTS